LDVHIGAAASLLLDFFVIEVDSRVQTPQKTSFPMADAEFLVLTRPETTGANKGTPESATSEHN
jgi:hypothetical protein